LTTVAVFVPVSVPVPLARLSVTTVVLSTVSVLASARWSATVMFVAKATPGVPTVGCWVKTSVGDLMAKLASEVSAIVVVES
jgi:hypothetical protein